MERCPSWAKENKRISELNPEKLETEFQLALGVITDHDCEGG
jgi:hypothetical protein